MSQAFKPAKQERGKQTQERILQATRKLLVDEDFESISVRQIVREAKTSIGSFYARFQDKHALLSVLFAEYEETLTRRLTGLQAALDGASSMEESAQHIVSHFVERYGEIPNLSRALYEFATRHPKSEELEILSRKRRQQYAFLNDALAAYAAEITHPDPERAVELAIYFMIVACRNRLLYPYAPQTRTMKISKNELKIELARLLTGYLCNP